MRTYFVFLILFLSIPIVGCDKIDTSDNGSIYGAWKVNLTVPPYSTYMVNIESESAGKDTVVVINNFLNQGGDMVYCKLKDSTLTIWQSTEVSGTGVYHKHARKITWNYNVFGSSGFTQVYATYTKN